MSFLDEIIDTGGSRVESLSSKANNHANNEDQIFRKPFAPPIRRVAPSVTGMTNLPQINLENSEPHHKLLEKFINDIKQHFTVLPPDVMMKLHYHYIEQASHELVINDRKKRNVEGSSNAVLSACGRCTTNEGQQLGYNAPSISSRGHPRSVINALRNFDTGPMSLRNFDTGPVSLRGEIVNNGRNNLAQEYTRSVANASSVSGPMSMRRLINERMRGIPRRGNVNIPGSILEVETAECEEENAGIYMPTAKNPKYCDVDRIFQWTLLLVNDEDAVGLAIAGKLEKGSQRISHVSTRILKVQLDNILVTATRKYSPVDESTLIGIPKTISDRYMKTGRFPKKLWMKMTKEWSELEMTKENHKLETTEKRSSKGRLLKKINMDIPTMKYTSPKKYILTDDSMDQTDFSVFSFKRKRKVAVKRKTNDTKVNETMTTRSKSKMEAESRKHNTTVKQKELKSLDESKKKTPKRKDKLSQANKRKKVDNSKEETPKEVIKATKKSRVVANLEMNKKKQEDKESSSRLLINEMDELFGNVSSIDQISINALSPGTELKNMTKGSVLTLVSDMNTDDDIARMLAPFPNVTSASGISAISTPLSKSTVKTALAKRLKKPSEVHILKDKFKKQVISIKADQERAKNPVRLDDSLEESGVSDFEDIFHDEPEESVEY